MDHVLITGATGYIGSHTWLALHEAGFSVVGVDNFSNSSPKVLDRLTLLTGKEPVFEQADVCDEPSLRKVFARYRIGAVIHFAAFKAVGESNAAPLDYYRNNVGGLVSVCRSMEASGCRRFVFSSSATVYGDASRSPISEDSPLAPASPYAQTKVVGEQVLRAIGEADGRFRFACLRYFNPAGAHPSGLLGEEPRGVPNNLMPYVAQVATGKRAKLQVFGGDYQTKDGTGVRDYIHVMDVAGGHVAALWHMLEGGQSFTVNLGTGHGNSVLEVVRAYEAASGRDVAFEVAPRRPGDVAAYFADATRAKELLGWRALRTLEDMCSDSWRWHQMNPRGFETEAEVVEALSARN